MKRNESRTGRSLQQNKGQRLKTNKAPKREMGSTLWRIVPVDPTEDVVEADECVVGRLDGTEGE